MDYPQWSVMMKDDIREQCKNYTKMDKKLMYFLKILKSFRCRNKEGESNTEVAINGSIWRAFASSRVNKAHKGSGLPHQPA